MVVPVIKKGQKMPHYLESWQEQISRNAHGRQSNSLKQWLHKNSLH